MNTFLKRTISGAVYALVLIGCVLWCKYSFLVLILFFSGVMMQEFLNMTIGDEYRPSQILTIFTGLSFICLGWAIRSFPAVTAEFVFLSLIPLFLLMINSLYVKDKADFGKFANVYTSIVYIALPMSINTFLVMEPNGNYCGLLLICFYILIWCSDIGAYLFGITLGQKYGKKLFPSISPKKSWIGFWGGLFMTVVAGLVLYFTGIWEYVGLKGFTWYHAVILSVIMDVSGVYGDLFESQWKRHYAVKDSGTIIPGHGGLLDRLDSALFAVPLGAIYLSLFKYFSFL